MGKSLISFGSLWAALALIARAVCYLLTASGVIEHFPLPDNSILLDPAVTLIVIGIGEVLRRDKD